MAKHVVAEVGEIGIGQRKVVSIRGRPIVIFNHNGEYFAVLDRCPHSGARLSYGELMSVVESDAPGEYRRSRPGEMLKCPWHGWEFDIRTGKSWCDPSSTKLRDYDVEVKPGSELIEGPYVAETFKVSAGSQYVVIEL